MELHTIIFDFDGTLHDSMHIYPQALATGYRWLVQQGFAQPHEFSDAEMTSFIGLTSDEMWARFAPDLPTAARNEAALRVGQVMDELIDDGTARLFPGVPEMLTSLKDAGYRLVFLSNCRTAYKEAARRAFSFDRYFDGYYDSESFGNIPKEQIFDSIALKFTPGYAVVGDRYKDLTVARAHNLPSVGCLYGYGSLDELRDATHLALSPQEIPGLIDKIAYQMGTSAR